MVPPAHIGFLGQGWSPDPGGIETHTRALARGLVEAGHAVSALALGPASRVTLDGVDLTRVPRPAVDVLADLDGTPQGLAALRRWLRTARPDLVHVHHLSGWGTVALEELHAQGVPFLVTLHDDWLTCPRGQRWHVEQRACPVARPEDCASCLARSHAGLQADAPGLAARIARASAALQQALHVQAPSEALATAHQRAGVDASIEVVPLGVDGATLAAQVEALRLARAPGAALRLGYLGSVQPSKGVFELAEALHATAREDLVLEVHGPRAPYHGDATAVTRLEELAARDGRVRLHPAFAPEDLPALLAALDAVAVPSLWEEGFGLVAREARAVGLPVLATARGGLRELAPDPGVTWLDAEDPSGWGAALEGLRPGLVPCPSPAVTEDSMVRDHVERVGRLLRDRRAA